MTAPQPLWQATQPSYHHASIEEYTTFIRGYLGDSTAVPHYLRMRKQFVEAYPDLQAWFDAPLAERVGRLHGDSLTAPRLLNRVSYLGRPYLYFLAIRGYVQFDWEWLLTARLDIWRMLTYVGRALGVPELVEKAVELGYSREHAVQALQWATCRMFLHSACFATGEYVTATSLMERTEAVRRFCTHPDVALLCGSSEQYRRQLKAYLSHLHLVHVVLYHSGQTSAEPHRIMPAYADRPLLKPRMEAVVTRYLTTRRLTDRPATVEKFDQALRHFVTWLTTMHPHLETFADVTRDHLLAFAEALDVMLMHRTGLPLAPWSKLRRLSCLSVFFREVAAWGWEDVPGRPLLGPGDLPKMPERVPRYIPADELTRLMTAIRALGCPYQRAALLIAR